MSLRHYNRRGRGPRMPRPHFPAQFLRDGETSYEAVFMEACAKIGAAKPSVAPALQGGKLALP